MAEEAMEGHNGQTRFFAIVVTLVIFIVGVAFGFGAAFNQLAQLRDQMNYLSQVNQRLAVIDEHLSEIENHLNAVDLRVNSNTRNR